MQNTGNSDKQSLRVITTGVRGARLRGLRGCKSGKVWKRLSVVSCASQEWSLHCNIDTFALEEIATVLVPPFVRCSDVDFS